MSYKKMKICLVVDTFPRLSETFVLRQALGLIALGHEVHVLCNHNQFAVEEPIIKAKSFRNKTHQWWGPLSKLKIALDRYFPNSAVKLRSLLDIMEVPYLQSFDAIVAHFGYEGLRIAKLSHRVENIPPLITIFHGHDVATVERDGEMQMYDDLFEEGSLHLAVNASFRKILVEEGAPRGRTHIHHMGISTDDFEYHPRDWSSNNLKLLSVCRLTEKKGIKYALDAVARAKKARPDIKWSYTIIGEGELRKGLEEHATELGIKDNVEFLGAQTHEEVQKQLQYSHVLLQPSVTAANGDAEGIPIVLMEAMASGAIAVSSIHSGIPELIQDGVNGFLAPERNEVILSEKLIEISKASFDNLKMTESARSYVELNFNSKVQVKKLETSIIEAISSK